MSGASGYNTRRVRLNGGVTLRNGPRVKKQISRYGLIAAQGRTRSKRVDQAGNLRALTGFDALAQAGAKEIESGGPIPAIEGT